MGERIECLIERNLRAPAAVGRLTPGIPGDHQARCCVSGVVRMNDEGSEAIMHLGRVGCIEPRGRKARGDAAEQRQDLRIG